MTHTPEPWGIVGDGTGRNIWAYAPDEVNGQLTEPTYHVIAQTFGPDCVARPNAILIHAAPDLLEACIAAIRYDDAIRQCGNDPQKMNSFCTAQGDTLDTLYFDWMTKARAAKATGTR